MRVLADVEGWIQRESADGHKTVSTLTAAIVLDSSAVHLATIIPLPPRPNRVLLPIMAPHVPEEALDRQFACYKRPSSPNSRVMEVLLQYAPPGHFSLSLRLLFSPKPPSSPDLSRTPPASPVPNATLNVQNRESGVTRRVSSNQQGIYSFAALAARHLRSHRRSDRIHPVLKTASYSKWTSAQQ